MKSDGIYLSIKPKFVSLIVKGEKNYEFRKYIPKRKFSKIYIYETLPKAEIKYVVEIEKIIKYPDKIIEPGYGNDDFNNGIKKSKYAYKLGKIKKLKNPIQLKELKEKYNFCPPQSYTYAESQRELTNYIENNII